MRITTAFVLALAFALLLEIKYNIFRRQKEWRSAKRGKGQLDEIRTAFTVSYEISCLPQSTVVASLTRRKSCSRDAGAIE